MKCYTPAKQRGFSLLEVLVAFTIFAISFAMLMQVYSKASNSARLSEEYATALLIARSSLDRAGAGLIQQAGIEEQHIDKYHVETTSSTEEIVQLTAEYGIEKRHISVSALAGRSAKSHQHRGTTNTRARYPQISLQLHTGHPYQKNQARGYVFRRN